MSENRDVSALILAGGKGRRLGNMDKGLIRARGKTLTEWALARISPQVGEVLISANRHLDAYGRFGPRVLVDERPDFAGPLAGLEQGLIHCATPWLLMVPCDTPLLPDDLVDRLMGAATESGRPVAVPCVGERVHHAVMLCRKSLLDDLTHYLDSEGRQVREWQCRHDPAIVPYDNASAFMNINTPSDLEHFEASLKT